MVSRNFHNCSVISLGHMALFGPIQAGRSLPSITCKCQGLYPTSPSNYMPISNPMHILSDQDKVSATGVVRIQSICCQMETVLATLVSPNLFFQQTCSLGLRVNYKLKCIQPNHSVYRYDFQINFTYHSLNIMNIFTRINRPTTVLAPLLFILIIQKYDFRPAQA